MIRLYLKHRNILVGDKLDPKTVSFGVPQSWVRPCGTPYMIIYWICLVDDLELDSKEPNQPTPTLTMIHITSREDEMYQTEVATKVVDNA